MLRIVLTLLLVCGQALALTSNFPITIEISQIPGPDVELWNNPPYTCVSNVYVSTTGLSTNAGTINSPYDLVTAVTNKSWTAGTCVNIADGTYTIPAGSGLDIGGASNTTHGSSATPTGYVVFRAYQTMDGPHVLLSPSQTGTLWVVDNNAAYIWIDGLNLDGQLSATHSSQACLQATGNATGNLGDGRASHHVYATNMILQACGQAGFLGGNTDYLFLLHSTVYNCCWLPTFVLGSGISVYEPLALQGYSGTTCSGGDCSTNKHLAYDDFWCATGAQNSALNVCYSIVVAWNFSYANYNPQRSGNTGNSDGEGYESDDWAHRQQSCTGLTPGCPFNHNGLTMGNAFYGNGGPGYEINGTCGPTTTPSCSPAGVILAINNTAAYNGWDPQNGAADWGDFMVLGDAVGLHFINNVAISNNYPHPLFAANNYGFFVDQNNAQCTGTCANTGTEFLSNITFSASNNPNFAFINTTLTFPTTGTNKNLGNSNAAFVNATPMTPNTNAAPTLGNDDLRLCQGNGNPGPCTAASPAIAFGQGAFSIWQQTSAGAIDAGGCMVSFPGPVTPCPIKGDSLP